MITTFADELDALRRAIVDGQITASEARACGFGWCDLIALEDAGIVADLRDLDGAFALRFVAIEDLPSLALGLEAA